MDTAHVTVRHVPDDGGSTRRPSSPDLITASLGLLLPGEPMPVRLMNTIWADRHGVYDALTTVSNLRAWLAAVWPGDDTLQSSNTGDLGRFRALRDALRRLAALLTGDTRPSAASAITDVGRAVSEVNQAAALAPAWPQTGLPTGPTSAGPGRTSQRRSRALSSIARDAIDLMTGDTRASLRACHAPGCVLPSSKSTRDGNWCSTACGNRARAARHYERHHKTRSSE